MEVETASTEALPETETEGPLLLDHSRASECVQTSFLRSAGIIGISIGWVGLRVRDFPLEPDLFRSTFQSSNPIGQYIIHNYMRICTVALTTP